MIAKLTTLPNHGMKRQVVAQRLLAAVFAGRFAPEARLRVEHLAEQFGVSVTPIREALVQLAGIGIVELQPNRGAVLRPFGLTQLREICHLRRVLESEAARCACGRIAPVELRELAASFKRLDRAPRSAQWSLETTERDTQLHDLVLAHCGSKRLADEIGRYQVIFRALRDVHHQRRQALADYHEMNENAEHLAIVEALLADRPDEAAAAMGRHIDTAAAALAADMFPATGNGSTKRRAATKRGAAR